MSAGTCKHAASGCDYPTGQCDGSCMAKVSDGGPAFPYSSLAPDNVAGGMSPTMYADNTGMTLRDYFAGKALLGLFSMEANPRVGEICEPFRIDKHCDDMARHAYKLADAMLAAREKQS